MQIYLRLTKARLKALSEHSIKVISYSGDQYFYDPQVFSNVLRIGQCLSVNKIHPALYLVNKTRRLRYVGRSLNWLSCPSLIAKAK